MVRMVQVPSGLPSGFQEKPEPGRSVFRGLVFRRDELSRAVWKGVPGRGFLEGGSWKGVPRGDS